MSKHLPFPSRHLVVVVALLALHLFSPRVCLAAGQGAAHEDAYRLFLNDGTAVATVGEFARVGGRVVFSIAAGNDNSRLQVVTLPESAVDWNKTNLYVQGIRAAHYAATRGEADYATLTADVAKALTRASGSPDAFERLQLVEQARGIVVTWGRDHYAYRAEDVRRIELLLDDMVMQMRAEAGIREVNLELVANVEPPPIVEPLPKPTLQESIEQVLHLADASDVPSERTALRQAALKIIDGAPRGSLPSAWAKRTRHTTASFLNEDTRIDRAYKDLSSSAIARSRAAASQADSNGLEAILAEVQRQDEHLGRKRPQEVTALLAVVEQQLDAARRLRLARDKWKLTYPLLRDYQRLVRQPMRQLQSATNVLDAIRRVSGPDVETLLAARERFDRAARTVQMITAPAAVSGVHATLTSACQMAVRAAEMREKAIQSGNLQYAWDASSAAAGALMLIAQARAQIESALKPPGLPAAPAGAAK